jgi:hypothetical protein
MLFDAFREEKAMKQNELSQTVREWPDFQFTEGWGHDFIAPYPEGLQVCLLLSQEDLGLAVPTVYLEEHMCVLKSHVFNWDGLNSSD